MELLEKLVTMLREEFPGAEPQLELIEGSGPAGEEKIGGSLAWSGFLGLPHTDRQRMLRSFRNRCLTADEEMRLSAILTFTPEELRELQVA